MTSGTVRFFGILEQEPETLLLVREQPAMRLEFDSPPSPMPLT